MPRGVPLNGDLETMIEMVLKERKIALPTKRLYWYAQWFCIPCSYSALLAHCDQMARAGVLRGTKDGKDVYWELIGK